MEEVVEGRSTSRHEYPDLDDDPTFAWSGSPSASRVEEDTGEWDDDDDNDDDDDDDDDDDELYEPDEDLDDQTPGVWDGQYAEDGFSSSDDETSDEDEGFYTLQSDVATFQQNLRNRGRSRDDDSSSRRVGRRGPRKPAEPSLEIKLLLSQANEAFISKDYDRAEECAIEVIQMNAETYAAHALLSGIFLERGETQMGIVAQMSAAHLRPKDVSLWRSCVKMILDHSIDDRRRYLKDAIYCYTRMIQINPKDIESRYQRALLLRELGHKGKAVHEFETMLEILPHDPTLLRQLAEVYVDLNEVEKAKEQYRSYIAAAAEPDDPEAESFSWSDLNIFVELFGYKGECLEGVKELKTLSRWLLGREQESYWDDIQEDDREWDAEDSPRRILTEGFVQGLFARESYGEGLPLELRVKLGVYRLKADTEHLNEAMLHFEWLQPDDSGPEAKIFDYPDLFLDVADALLARDHHHEALRFYKPLLQVDAYHNVRLCLRMATCYNKLGLVDEAEQHYKEVVENDARNKEARVQLAKIYEALDMPDEAFTYVNEVLELERQDVEERRLRRGRAGPDPAAENNADSFLPPPSQPVRTSTRKRGSPSNSSAKRREEREKDREILVRTQYARLQAVEDRMKSDDEDAVREWMEAASMMIKDFRGAKVFYPWDKYIKFLGYTRGPQAKGSRSKDDLVADMEAMGNRLQATLQQEEAQNGGEKAEIPTTYRNIGFGEWLDIFLRYALCLAKRGETKASYEIINAAYDAVVFYHSSDSVYLIYVCWSACALLAGDDETICNVARWFMKEFQFTTDAYRFHAALNRLCRGPNTWYNSGPSQKFILRQVKAMDYSLVSEEQRLKHFGEKASYTSKDSEGNLAVNDDMDVALLTLYGHMLYAGTNYAFALTYFFRAYSCDPTNPLLNLFLGLCYIHYALKRQSTNRHHLITQGLSFLLAYHDMRMQSPEVVERQEAEFNLARTYHTLGLTHLATPYYEKVLDMSTTIMNQAGRPEGTTQDFVRDAAYNLQNIYYTAGNLEMAKKVTDRYLVI
ncbi:MAG: transcription factor TFIIIC subunit tfc4 [Peltula sp. TS41687]|nr:MAG: transcription factor TFIIIC subunit tfc4 [Peltula sp. TS41687]